MGSQGGGLSRKRASLSCHTMLRTDPELTIFLVARIQIFVLRRHARTRTDCQGHHDGHSHASHQYSVLKTAGAPPAPNIVKIDTVMRPRSQPGAPIFPTRHLLAARSNAIRVASPVRSTKR